MSGYLYLASPYSHADAAVREERFKAACRAAAHLMLEGHVVFSPIAHSHSVEVIGLGTVKDGQFWKRQDMPMLRSASGLVVLRLPGWEQSRGVAWEIATAEAIDLPVSFMDPAP